MTIRPHAPETAREVPLALLTAGVLDPPGAPAEIRVSDVTLDSRTVRPGALFLACRGASRHGLEFAGEAVAAGARAILYEPRAAEEGLPVPNGSQGSPHERAVFYAPVPQLANHAGTIADRFFGEPSQSLAVAGVTGTNGKTTSAYVLAQALTRLGRPAGYLGTLGAGLPGAIAPFGLTTADVVTVHRQLAQLRALGAECVSMEVSSHALEQGRVNGVRFRAAAFTNLTRDHLDFHGSMDAYGAAKARLLERDLAARIINIDDAFGLSLARRFAGAAGRQVVTARRLNPGAMQAVRDAEYVCARRVEPRPRGSALSIDSSWGSAHLEVPLLGDFNADNVLTVLGLLLSQDVPLDKAAAALAGCTAPPGRMEIIEPSDRVLAIVDYAHTPDGLANALRAARAHCAGTLRVVFGCGGDRDSGKRPLMGRTASELADEIVVTDDNPRSEDPRRIVAGILEGIGAGAAARVEHDRATAIRDALARSLPGDLVLIAGKGHEDYQLVGRERRPFSDQAVVREWLQASKGQACSPR
jgi:UDP-N-acetylmuramoyl-L-alanyl-D-glutamate--2,6-diaminopimelate ligase